MQIFIETPRLILREMSQVDAEGMFIMDSDPEVHKYLGNRPVKDMDTIKIVINFVRQQYISNGIGRWSVIDKESGQFMGWAGFKLNTEPCNGHINYIDIGYRLQRQHWGKGIATECSQACMQYGLSELKYNQIFAAAHIDNVASNRILKKIGLAYKNQFTHDNELCNWYALK